MSALRLLIFFMFWSSVGPAPALNHVWMCVCLHTDCHNLNIILSKEKKNLVHGFRWLALPDFQYFFHHQAFLLVGFNIQLPACFCPSCVHWQLHCRTATQDSPRLSASQPLCLPLSLWCVSGVGLEPGRQPCPSVPSIKQWAGWQREDDGQQRRGRCFAGTDTCSRPRGMSLRGRQRIV